MAAMLEIQDNVSEGRHTLVLSGELDIASSGDLEESIRRSCSNGTTALILDLSGLKFMDSTGIHVVLRTDELCRGRACDFRVRAGAGPIRRLFEITGLLDAPFLRDGAGPSATA